MTLISRSRHWMVLDHRTQIVNEQSALSTKESLVKCLSASNFCFANRLALRNRPKNITRHAAQKTTSSLSLIFNTLIRNNMSGVIGLFLFTAVPLTLSIPFKVEEMNQLSFNGLLKSASRCMTLTMFKYCRTDAGRSRLAKEAAYIAIVFSFTGTGGTHSSVQKRRKEFLWDV